MLILSFNLNEGCSTYHKPIYFFIFYITTSSLVVSFFGENE